MSPRPHCDAATLHFSFIERCEIKWDASKTEGLTSTSNLAGWASLRLRHFASKNDSSVCLFQTLRILNAPPAAHPTAPHPPLPHRSPETYFSARGSHALVGCFLLCSGNLQHVLAMSDVEGAARTQGRSWGGDIRYPPSTRSSQIQQIWTPPPPPPPRLTEREGERRRGGERERIRSRQDIRMDVSFFRAPQAGPLHHLSSLQEDAEER